MVLTQCGSFGRTFSSRKGFPAWCLHSQRPLINWARTGPLQIRGPQRTWIACQKGAALGRRLSAVSSSNHRRLKSGQCPTPPTLASGLAHIGALGSVFRAPHSSKSRAIRLAMDMRHNNAIYINAPRQHDGAVAWRPAVMVWPGQFARAGMADAAINAKLNPAIGD
jgi:hypothetical protein